MMDKNQKVLITISRQFGSGGREISKIVAEKLGVRRYDKKIVEMAADRIEGGMDQKEAVDLSYNTPTNCLGNLGDYGYERVSKHNQMYIEQAKVILGIAAKENAVFLGRCADYILKDKPGVYSFFIYADDEFRAERAKTDYDGMSLKDLDKEEKRRKQYYEFYTGQTWGTAANYDLMINSSRLTLEEAADLIIDYVEKNPR